MDNAEVSHCKRMVKNHEEILQKLSQGLQLEIPIFHGISHRKFLEFCGRVHESDPLVGRGWINPGNLQNLGANSGTTKAPSICK